MSYEVTRGYQSQDRRKSDYQYQDRGQYNIISTSRGDREATNIRGDKRLPESGEGTRLTYLSLEK